MQAENQAETRGKASLWPHRRAPWWIKAGAQAALSLLPFGEALNYRLQIWNGFCSNFDRDIDRNIQHLCALVRTTTRLGLQLQDANILEVGTGWIPTLPIGMYLLGAKQVHTYDHVRHLRTANLARLLGLYSKHLPVLAEAAHSEVAPLEAKLSGLKARQGESLDQWLNPGGIHYYAPGDASQTGLADKSLDLCFSVAVLGHVSVPGIKAMLHEAYRTLRAGGLTYHAIGLFDQYTHVDPNITRVNFLKYSDFTWRILGQNRIQFQNRLRQSEFLLLFREAGFEIVDLRSEVDQRSLEALETMRLNPQFNRFDKKDLATTGTFITARKPIPSQT
jgi:hypothetical protein